MCALTVFGFDFFVLCAQSYFLLNSNVLGDLGETEMGEFGAGWEKETLFSDFCPPPHLAHLAHIL